MVDLVDARRLAISLGPARRGALGRSDIERVDDVGRECHASDILFRSCPLFGLYEQRPSFH